MVTETTITTTTTTTIEEKYRVVAPESMQETFMSDSEDEGGKVASTVLHGDGWGKERVCGRHIFAWGLQFIVYCTILQFTSFGSHSLDKLGPDI